MKTWQEHWEAAAGESHDRSPSFDQSAYYSSGRASKEFPNKENPDWWAVKGPAFVQSWVNWRNNCGLKIWEFADQETGELEPAIELEVYAHGPNDLVVRSIIDRVFVDAEDQLYIVDLKSGSYTPPWPLQLALNNLGLAENFGRHARWGGFWKARTGGIHPDWHDLSIFTDEWLWDQVGKAREIRDRQLFLANPNNLCTSSCGVKDFCVAMGGKPFFAANDATFAQNNRSENG